MTQLVRGGSLLDDFFRDFPFGYQVAPLHGDALPTPRQFKIDVKENDGDLIVQAEMPGVKKDDIDISIDRNMVTIGAEIEQYDADRNNDKVLHSERYYGSVKRSFTLPAEVAGDRAEAKYSDGILTLTIPRVSQDASRKITVG